MTRGSILLANPGEIKKELIEKSVMKAANPGNNNDLFSQSKRSPFSKFLEKSDIIEIAIRSPQVSNKEELKLITLLYKNLKVPTNETVSLYKLLIYYEQVQTFEMLLSYRSLNSSDLYESDKRKSTLFESATQDLTLGRKDDDNIYDLDEVVSDAFSYSISLNKLHVAFYLINKYKDDVYGNQVSCIKSIFDSFRNDNTQINHLLYLEERLFILEKFIKFIDYKMGLEFLTIIHDQILEDPKKNFLVFCSNPLKITLMLLNLSIHIGIKHQNLRFKAQKLRSSLCDIANSIINSSSNMNEIEDLLKDKNYSGVEVIDMIEYLDIIEILQNPMIDSIISNMYFGPYEREFFIKKSTCYKIIDEQIHGFPGTEPTIVHTFRLFEQGNSFKQFFKYFKSQTKMYRFCRNKNFLINEDYEEPEASIGHMFQFQIWKKSLDVQYLVDTVIVLIIAFLMLSYANVFTNADSNISTQSTVIQNLESQTSTPNIQSQLLKEYVTMKGYSNSYIDNLNALIGLCVLTYTYTLKDIQEIIYCHLRKVYIQTFTYQLLMNFCNSCVVTYWLIKHVYSFSRNLEDVRVELRGSTIRNRMMDDPSFDILVILAILISIQFARLLFSLQVNRNIGPMVKILGSMFIDVSIFLVLFVTIFLIFLAIGQLLFPELDQFTSPTNAAITLFSASLGNFDYSIFAVYDVTKTYTGYVYLTIYLLYTAIMLLNFLIAILSNTYARNNTVKNGLYLRNVLHLRQRYDYDRYYSSIIYSAPPLNVITFILTPLIICLKSRGFNRFVLVTQYVPIGLCSVILFVIVSIFISPISWLLIFIQKIKYIGKMPILGAKDIFLRLLDFFVFLFIGLFEICCWIVLDTISYSLMLFAYNIVYINDYEEVKQDQIIQEMDGSLKPDINEETDNKTPSHISIKKIPIFKVSSKNINPVKDGLSDNTLKILKGCLKTLKDRHMQSTGKLAQNNANYYFLPTICVLEEMRSILLIHEQINAILFGFTYKKNEDFFLSDKYDTLIECLAEYERKDIIVEAEDEELDLNAPQETEQQLYTTKTSIKKKEGDSRKGIWDYRIRSFLIKSNEKWILDQFNLCKKFLNQNSIQGNYEDFLHPVYQYCYNDFKHFRILREKFLSNEKFNKFKGVSSPKSSSARSGISSSSNSLDSTALQGFEVFDLSVIKCDICALLRAIEEIENKIRMNKILRRSHRKGKISTDQILSDEKSKDKFIRQNFSMLNFNRNFVAIEFAQKNPSDQRNKLHS